MKKILIFALISLMAAAASAQAQTDKMPIAPEPIPFTYQGKLTLNSLIAQGAFDFQIYLCSSNDPSTQPTIKCLDYREISGVAVVNGVFTVHLDFAREYFNQFEALYLEIQVRHSGTGDEYTTLTPRQQIDASPFAISARALNCTDCITDSHIVSISAAKVNGKVASAANADNAANAVNAQNASNATFATTAQNALNAVDLTNNQSISGNKTFTGILSGNGSGITNVPGTLKWNVSTGGNVQMQPNNGYVLTNTTASTVTLPASPAVGDVVRVTEKGTGGFTLAMNSGQSILDWAATHLETTWTRQYTLGTYPDTANFVSIASSTDGQRVAAVEYLNGFLYLSQNGGQTWTSPMLNSRNYTSVAVSADGSKLIAAVENGHIFTSADWGGTWTERFADANRSWYSVAVSGDGTKLYAVDIQNVWVSINGGVSWTSLRSMSNHVGYIAASSDGTKLVLAEHNGHVWTSSNAGATWIDRLSSTLDQWQSVASSADGSKLVAADRPGYLWISSDSGATWTQKTSVGPSGANTSWAGVSMSSDGMRIAASAVNSSSYPGVLTISYDGGNSWTPTGTGTSWLAVAFAGNGNRLSAAMTNGTLNKLYTGPVQTITVVDTITGVKDSAVELVYIGSNRFAMVSSNGMTIPPHTY